MHIYTIYIHIHESSTPSSPTLTISKLLTLPPSHPLAHLHLHHAYQTLADSEEKKPQKHPRTMVQPVSVPVLRFAFVRFGRTKFTTERTTASMFTNGGFVHSSTTESIHTTFHTVQLCLNTHILIPITITHTSPSCNINAPAYTSLFQRRPRR
jgi:fatty acid desaturase